jgi:hypothetical protein
MARIRRVDSYARRAPTREPYDTVLIVCEGSKTEPNYFNGLKSAHRLSSANIEVTNAPGTDPMSVVTYTEALMGDYDRAFSVFDRDGHQNFTAAIQRVAASARGQAGSWHAITSTPSFEVWLLLHYQYSTASIIQSGAHSAGDMAVRALRVHLPGYAKGAKDIFDQLSGMTDTAMANAVKLDKHNGAVGSVNPSTGVHVLVNYLRRLKAR